MSHVALQRVMVRMLYDPGFARRVLGDPDGALAGIDLTAEERGWLLGPDPRAWRVDSERPVRSLNILLQQYPAAGALAVRSAEGPGPLLAFFGSAPFHASVQERGSMALAFGDYLADQAAAGSVPDRRVTALARLEQAIVRLHRDAPPSPEDPGEGSAWRLSTDKALHTAPRRTADLHEAIHVALAGSTGDLARAVLDSPASMPGTRLDPARPEFLLLELVRDDGPRVRFAAGATEITRGLYEFLAFAGAPRDFDALVGEITKLGADASEAPDVVSGLIEDGTLVPAV